MPKANEFFIQGACNCKKCREERKLVATSEMVNELKAKLPFLPAMFDLNEGFAGFVWESTQQLENKANEVLAHNKKKHPALKRKHKSIQVRFCADCGKVHVKNRKHKVSRASKVRYICDECFNDRYLDCTECGKFTRMSEGKNVNIDGSIKKYCYDCANRLFTSCEMCDTLWRRSDLIDITENIHIRGKAICPTCVQNKCVKCQECGVLITKDGIYRHDEEEILCKFCYEKHQPLHNAGYKPTPIFYFNPNTEKGESKTRYYFGFELEVEFPDISGMSSDLDAMAKKVLQEIPKDRVYNKSDGSLRSGFEVVSYPMSWAQYRAERKDWDRYLEHIKALGGRADSGRCGFHIHVNKKSFTTFHTYKLIDFIYKPTHRNLIAALSGRPGGYTGNFCQYASLDKVTKKEVAAITKNKSGTGHHHAVDVTPLATYEFRFFGGTVDPTMFHRHIETCYLLWEYTQQVSGLWNNVRSFVRYLKKHRNRFRYVYDALVKDRSLLAEYYIMEELL